jgi:uncharacterized repeat protein (TIGR03803 family)
LSGLSAFLFVLIVAATPLPAVAAPAATFNIIHNFCTPDGCITGGGAASGLIEDSSGNLYGTAGGGAQYMGVVFELSPAGNNSWTYQVLYSFCAQANCTDGSFPVGPVIIDKKGNLYGTTYYGGASNNGTAFELVYQKGAPYTEKVLYNFCSQANCVDGRNPNNNLTYAGAASNKPYDGRSPLYGAFYETGAYGDGFVFALQPGKGEKPWVEKSLYSFCAGGGSCADGGLPGYVTLDKKGNLLGTTFQGGADAGGTVFELSPKGKKKWTETLLYSFCAELGCADGGGPDSIVLDKSGDIYGVTNQGGYRSCGGISCGVAFKLVPKGGKYTYNLLYNFCSQANCADGFGPTGTLALDASGNLYGTTPSGGSDAFEQYGGGVLFELSGTSYQLLHTFCATSCNDGANPGGGVLIDSAGDVFGTTANLGNPSGGAVFEWSP